MSAFPLACEVRPDRDRVIVRVAGELDLADAGRLQSTFDELIQAGFTRLVVDARDLSFIDSTGLRTLLAADQGLRHRGGRLTLVCADGQVRRLLALTGTDEVFALADARALR